MHEQGHEPGCDEREPEVRALVHDGRKASDESHVHGDDAYGQTAVDERPVDQQVDVVEPVAEDGDANGQRKAHDAEKDERVGDTFRPERADDRGRHQQRDGHPGGIREPLDLLTLDAFRATEPEDDRHRCSDDGAEGKDRAKSQDVDQEVVDAVRVLDLPAVQHSGGGGLGEGECCDADAPDPAHDTPATRQQTPVGEVQRDEHERNEHGRDPRPIREPGRELRDYL